MIHLNKNIAVVFLIWSVILPLKDARAEDYQISRLDAYFHLRPNDDGEMRNIRCSLMITYDVFEGPKTSGFKYIGTNPFRNVKVTDADGNPLRFFIEREKENKISWFFPPIMEGEKTVNVDFTLENAMGGDRKENFCEFEWIRNWRIPVKNVTYVLILPGNHPIEKISASPPGGTLEKEGELQVLRVHTDAVGELPFAVRFSPGIAEKGNSLFTWIAAGFLFVVRKSFVIIISFFGVILFIVGFLFLLRLFSKHGSGGGRGGDGTGGGCGSGGCGGGGCGGGGCGG